MKRFYLLAGAAALAACHSRNQDQAGAAPKTGDTTAVHVIDTTRTGPPGTAGRPAGSTVTLDSTGVDTSKAKIDTLAPGARAAPSPQDTLGPRATNGDTAHVDTSSTRR
jgi:hypothetical protein